MARSRSSSHQKTSAGSAALVLRVAATTLLWVIVLTGLGVVGWNVFHLRRQVSEHQTALTEVVQYINQQIERERSEPSALQQQQLIRQLQAQLEAQSATAQSSSSSISSVSSASSR